MYILQATILFSENINTDILMENGLEIVITLITYFLYLELYRNNSKVLINLHININLPTYIVLKIVAKFELRIV